jgi:dihydroorotate dehydrogenase
VGILACSGLFLLYASDVRAGIHRAATMPLVRFFIDPEKAHELAVALAKLGWIPRDRSPDDPVLETHIFHKTISNPIGLAAGLDKHGEAIDGLFSLGFSSVEIGSVTPRPQVPFIFIMKKMYIVSSAFS